MTQANTAAEDLDYVRQLAEEGAMAPLLSGRFLTWWGGLVALAYLGHYLIASGAAGLEMSAIGWLWGAFLLLGIGGQAFLVATFSRSKPGAASAGNRAEAAVWTAAGFALFAFFAGVIAKSFASGESSLGFQWSLPMVFAVYGVGLSVGGVMGRNPVLRAAGAAAIVAVAPIAFFVGHVELYLFTALAAAATVFLPGVLLLRREPAEIV
ncbi:MAG: hypothetical protein AAFX03_11310 [Pseudomonadota bacterium]